MSLRVVALLLASTTLAQAFADPPGDCGRDPKVPYRIIETDIPDRSCRTATWDHMPLPWPLQSFTACTVRGMVSTANPRKQLPMILIYMPRRTDLVPSVEGDWWHRVLRHEFGHVNCGDWH